ncbi:MAG: Zn-ribbon domain-containing OB-fold protein [Acidimicrobiia bacterium]
MGETVVAVREGLFADDHLLGARCAACVRHHFPRSSRCPYCGSDSVRETTLSGHGTLWAWTAVTAAPPGYRGPVPFGFGVVELPEGVRVITRLTEADPAKLTFGMAVHLVTDELHTDDDGATVVTYAFSP